MTGNQKDTNYGDAPRVTKERIESLIRSEHYFTAFDGRQGALARDSYFGRERPEYDDGDFIPLKLLTICVMVLENNYTVLGKSACASPENFNPEIGRQIARENAINEIWPLEGYLLKQSLYARPAIKIDASGITPEMIDEINKCEGGEIILSTEQELINHMASKPAQDRNSLDNAGDSTPAHVKRMVAEFDQLKERMVKLADFMVTVQYHDLSKAERDLMARQLEAMTNYAVCVEGRIKMAGDNSRSVAIEPDKHTGVGGRIARGDTSPGVATGSASKPKGDQ